MCDERKTLEGVLAFGPSLQSKTVVVSGGTSGIGPSVAEGFIEVGAKVIATGSSQNRLQAAISGDAQAGLHFERLDVRDGDAVLCRLDQLDVLVNRQGIARPDAEWEEEVFLDVMEVNLGGSVRVSLAVSGDHDVSALDLQLVHDWIANPNSILL